MNNKKNATFTQTHWSQVRSAENHLDPNNQVAVAQAPWDEAEYAQHCSHSVGSDCCFISTMETAPNLPAVPKVETVQPPQKPGLTVLQVKPQTEEKLKSALQSADWTFHNYEEPTRRQFCNFL